MSNLPGMDHEADRDELNNGPAKAALDPNADAEAAAAREELLEQRRARQMGGKPMSQKQKIKAGIALGVVALTLFGIMIGPAQTLRLFGFTPAPEGQNTSKVNLTVEKEAEKDFNLDLGNVPAPELAVEDTSAEDAMSEKLRLLEDKLALLESQKMSDQKLKDILAEQEKRLAETLEQQRRELAAENERLRQEAAKREEEARARAEAEKLMEEELKKLDEIDNKQKSSSGIVIDDSKETSGLSGSSDAGAATGAVGGNQRFLENAAASEFETSIAKPLSNPSKTIVQGTIISAVLETAIDTELPGNIRAQVIEPVFSYDGKRILMPSGTVLIGAFNPDINIAQKRVLIAWNRAITPAGQSIALGSTGTDTLGRAGTGGNVDNRYLPKLGAAVLVTTVNAVPSVLGSLFKTPSTGGGTSPVTVNVGGSGGGGSEFATGASEALAEQTSGFLEKYLSLPPVIRVPQGEEIRVFVNRDLVFR